MTRAIEREGNRAITFRKRSSSKGGTGNRARSTPGSITGKYIRGWKEVCADGMLNFTVIDTGIFQADLRDLLYCLLNMPSDELRHAKQNH